MCPAIWTGFWLTWRSSFDRINFNKPSTNCTVFSLPKKKNLPEISRLFSLASTTDSRLISNQFQSVYPEFSPNRDDIALLVLSNVVQLSELVISICIVGSRAVQEEDLVDRRGWVAGWGITEKGNLSTVLKTAQTPVVNNTECVQNDPGLFGRFVSPKMFCAGDRNGTSVCQGDSGGGLYMLAGDRWELRGITSFSGVTDTGACDVHRYVVFTKVSSYFEWIKRLTGEAVSKEDIVPKRISELSKYQQFTLL